MSSDAQRLIERLRLAPHPEGGWYRQVYRSSMTVQMPDGERAAMTTIYYLLERDQVSRWHVVDADEVWHYYGGAPLELFIYYPQTQQLSRRELGSPPEGRDAIAVVAAGAWQAARSKGAFSLMGCTVAPGFEYSGFRLVSDLDDHQRHFAGALHDFADLL
jgi:predicted cupin superfamily sugar epimerase